MIDSLMCINKAVIVDNSQDPKRKKNCPKWTSHLQSNIKNMMHREIITAAAITIHMKTLKMNDLLQ